MHFVTGGAYNGKTSWVRHFYGLEKRHAELSGYRNDQPKLLDCKEDIVLLGGLDGWIREDAKKMTPEAVRRKWKETMKEWRIWEKAKPERCCIVIGSDISKGIVPMEAENRRWRDACGWVYQDLATMADRVDIIWYGINQQVK